MTGHGVGQVMEYPRFEKRGTVRHPWWGKAWQAAIEEACYGDGDLKKGRRSARAGHVGRISIEPGRYVASVEVGDDVFTVEGTAEMLSAEGVDALVEVVAAQAGRIGALLAGDLPSDLVEECDEHGVELVPWSGDLTFTCTCEPWADPCPHAVAVATQVGWLLDVDPFVLLTLRGTSREALLEALNDRQQDSRAGTDEVTDDLLIAQEAALRAERLLAEIG